MDGSADERIPDEGEIAGNVCTILAMLKAGKLHRSVAQQVVKGAIWMSSNRRGRWLWSPYFSRAALNAIADNPNWRKDGECVNDHIIPRAVIEREILGTDPSDADSIQRLLGLSFTCLLTKGEDQILRQIGLRQSMSDGSCLAEQQFTRYERAGIVWVQGDLGRTELAHHGVSMPLD